MTLVEVGFNPDTGELSGDVLDAFVKLLLATMRSILHGTVFEMWVRPYVSCAYFLCGLLRITSFRVAMHRTVSHFLTTVPAWPYLSSKQCAQSNMEIFVFRFSDFFQENLFLSAQYVFVVWRHCTRWAPCISAAMLIVKPVSVLLYDIAVVVYTVWKLMWLW